MRALAMYIHRNKYMRTIEYLQSAFAMCLLRRTGAGQCAAVDTTQIGRLLRNRYNEHHAEVQVWNEIVGKLASG
jgi:hypothetical protein